MVMIEVFVYVCIASIMVFYVNVMNKAQLTKISDFISPGLILFLIIIQIFNPISSQTRDSNLPMALICIGAILTLVLVYVITRIATSSTDTQEYARIATLSGIFIVFGAIFCLILIDLPETKMDLYRMPFALALCIGMAYYPPVLDRLKASKNGSEQRPEEHEEAILDTEAATSIEDHKETVLDIATETNIEEYKDTVISLVTESWRFTTVYQRMLTNLDVSEHKKYTSQLRWHVKKLEESLEEGGLRIVNVEGHPYDPGMAATPVNIEDFDTDEPLVVNRMLEPIIMEGTVLVKTGKVTVRRIE